MEATPKRIGRFRIERYLASGGMADVYLAQLEGPGGFARRCVVKRIRTPFVEDDEYRRLFELEARLASQLHHPNVLQVFEYGEDDGYPFMVMEYIDGLSLRSAARLLRRRGEPFPLAVAARFFTQVCEGLYFAHTFRAPSGEPAGVIHRDISPDNMLLDRLGNCWLADFGIARLSTGPRTQTGTIKGKLAYLAPEVVRGARANVASDLYACGVSLFEVLAGRRPFSGENELELALAITERAAPRLTSVRTDVTPQLEEVVTRALSRDPAQRFADARGLGRAIEDAVAGEPAVDRSWLEAWVTALADEAQDLTGPGTPRQTTPGRVVPPSSVLASSAPPVLPSPHDTLADDDRSGAVVVPMSQTVQDTPIAATSSRLPVRAMALVFLAFAVGFLALYGARRGGLSKQSTEAATTPQPVEDEPVPQPPVAALVPEATEPAPSAVLPVDAGKAVVRPKSPAGSQPAFAALTIRTDPWTEVRLDGDALGPTPVLDRRVKLGRHALELRNPVFGILRKQVVAVPASGAAVAVAFPMGELRISGREGTRVLLQGQLLGTTPFRGPLPVGAGSHSVRLSGPGGDTTVRVTVGAGATVLIEVP
jgi:eukaryotic-like serine/threonine-protein kinase